MAFDALLLTPQACACGGRNFEPLLSLPAAPPCDAFLPDRSAARALARYPLDLCRCSSCGLVGLRQFVDPKALYSGYTYKTSNSPGLVEHFGRYAADLVAAHGLRAGDLVVDIGCNDGTLLRALTKHSVRVLGVEPSPVGVGTPGVPIVNDFFSSALAAALRREHGPAKVVTANNVMANILALADFLAGIGALLADDGVFVFETIDCQRLLDNVVVEMINHEHYYYFTVTALKTLLGKFGLHLVDVQPVGTKGGSFRCTAAKAGTTLSDAGLQPWIEKERDLGVERFVTRWRTAMASVADTLAQVAAGGRSIGGFGASAGTAILHSCLGPAADTIQVLVDDNASRHGLFAPGSGLEVVPPERYYAMKPAATLIYAWRFADQIIARHKPFLPEDHRFIVPLPDARVI